MVKSRLKSGTAALVVFALVTPMPSFAQTTEVAFPCVAPNGEEVANAEQFAQNLIASGAASIDAGTCTQDALDQALASGGDAVLAAPEQDTESAPEVVESARADTEVALESADAEPVPTPEAVIEPAPEVVAETPEEVPVAEEPAPVETEAAPTEEAPTDEEAVVEENPPVEETPPADEAAPTENAPVEQSPEEDVLDNTTAPVVAEDPTSEPEAAAPVVAKEAAPAPEVTSEPEAVEPAPPTESNAEPTAAQETPAGEAGGDVVTDEERQAIAAANAEAQIQTSAAATAGADESKAEVSTQAITQDDVRTSEQDFETSVSENAALVTQKNGDSGKRSNFEKALLLGLGAAVVGSILKNGDQVVSNSGDRVVIERDGELRVLKNDDELLQRPGSQVQTQTFQDGSTRTVLTYEDNSQIVTIRSSDGTVLRRTLIRASDGSEVVLFDDTRTIDAVDFASLPSLESLEEQQRDQDASLTAALQRALLVDVGRSFSLQQIRDYKRVRALASEVELDAVTFASGSAAIDPNQAEALRDLGVTMRDVIENDPSSVFLIEGHTDAVGAASYNLALSDRRAETVALALTEYFAVPPQNMITQGYGEADLKVVVLSDERANRRAVVRNISGLLY